jgi:hypothetical protein
MKPWTVESERFIRMGDGNLTMAPSPSIARVICAAHNETLPQWISATERLPEVGTLVLAIRENGTREIAWICHQHTDGTPAWAPLHPRALRTYWMPLPEPPTPRNATLEQAGFQPCNDGSWKKGAYSVRQDPVTKHFDVTCPPGYVIRIMSTDSFLAWAKENI